MRCVGPWDQGEPSAREKVVDIFLKVEPTEIGWTQGLETGWKREMSE